MDREPAPGPLSSIDLALLRAARVWGGESAAGLWARFPAERRSSLRWGWESGRAGDAATSLDRLRDEAKAQARPDLSRVHPSWWVRALHSEPPSIQRTVAANLPAGLAEAVIKGLNLAPDDLIPDRPAHPEALQTALALWTVRLIGDLPERDDDPAAIAALTQFDAPTLARLIQTTGLARWVLTTHPLPALERSDLARVEPLRLALKGIDPRFLQVATRDVESLDATDPHAVARAGMTSMARLLQAAEPYRVRWALQHLPYTTARSLRRLMGPGGRKAPLLVRWESEVLRAAWTRLHDEGRLSASWVTTERSP